MDRNLMIIQQAISPILEGMVKVTIPLSLLSCLVGLFLAFVLILMRYSRFSFISGLSKATVWLMRGLPLLVLLYFLFYGLAEFNIMLSSWQTGLIAFSLYVGAFMSESLRGSLLAIEAGQWEAGLSLGLPKQTIFKKIIIPQAIPAALPSLVGYIISAIKMTSLVSNIGLADMMLRGKQFIDYYYAPFLIYALVGLIYLILFALLSLVQKWTVKRFTKSSQDNLAKFLQN